MKFRILVLIMLSGCFFSGCKNSPKKKRTAYYIIDRVALEPRQEFFIENGDTLFLPKPTTIDYGNHNFILAGDDRIFYHHIKDLFRYCGNGPDNTQSEIKAASPTLKQIEPANLAAFLEQTVKEETANYARPQVVKIASPTDTIFNPAVNQISAYLKPRNALQLMIIPSTPLENCVVNALENGKPFNRKDCGL